MGGLHDINERTKYSYASCNARPRLDSGPAKPACPPARMNYRFLVPLMTTAFLEQTVVTIVRVTTSYRAVELGLSVVWLGVITTAIAVLPLLLAVKVGRYIDKGNETRRR